MEVDFCIGEADHGVTKMPKQGIPCLIIADLVDMYASIQFDDKFPLSNEEVDNEKAGSPHGFFISNDDLSKNAKPADRSFSKFLP